MIFLRFSVLYIYTHLMYIQRYLLGIYAGYLIDAVCVLFVQYSTQCDFYSTFSLSIFIRFYRIFDNTGLWAFISGAPSRELTSLYLSYSVLFGGKNVKQ